MTPHLVRCWLLGQACVARIEGMRAENTQREHRGQPPAYGEEAFFVEAMELERLATEVIQT